MLRRFTGTVWLVMAVCSFAMSTIEVRGSEPFVGSCVGATPPCSGKSCTGPKICKKLSNEYCNCQT